MDTTTSCCFVCDSLVDLRPIPPKNILFWCGQCAGSDGLSDSLYEHACAAPPTQTQVHEEDYEMEIREGILTVSRKDRGWVAQLRGRLESSYPSYGTTSAEAVRAWYAAAEYRQRTAPDEVKVCCCDAGLVVTSFFGFSPSASTWRLSSAQAFPPNLQMSFNSKLNWQRISLNLRHMVWQVLPYMECASVMAECRNSDLC